MIIDFEFHDSFVKPVEKPAKQFIRHPDANMPAYETRKRLTHSLRSLINKEAYKVVIILSKATL